MILVIGVYILLLLGFIVILLFKINFEKILLWIVVKLKFLFVIGVYILLCFVRWCLVGFDLVFFLVLVINVVIKVKIKVIILLIYSLIKLVLIFFGLMKYGKFKILLVLNE